MEVVQPTQPTGPGTPPLTVKQRQDWNRFIDFMDKSGYKGSKDLDNRDTNLGRFLFQRFKSQNKDVGLTYEDVPRVQQELQDYRNLLLQQFKGGKIKPEGMKDPEKELMPGLSAVDGWLGSKTSSYKFPTAVATDAQGQTTNYGVNTESYDQARMK